MRIRKATLLLLLAAVICGLTAGPAGAAEQAPGWALFGRTEPTDLPPGGEGQIKLYAMDIGAAEANPGAIVTDTLPAGLTAKGLAVKPASELGLGECGTNATEKVVSCKLNWSEGQIERSYRVTWAIFRVAVDAAASGEATDEATIAGGGALEPTSTSFPVHYGAGVAPAGIAGFGAWLSNADGTPDTQAGSHPYDFTTVFAMNSRRQDTTTWVETPAGGQERNLEVNLPPGLVGNPEAVPRCTRAQFDIVLGDGPDCPIDSQVGVNLSSVQGYEGLGKAAIYNLVPPPGVAAQFGFLQAGIPVFIDSGVRTGTDNGIATHVDNVPTRSITFNLTTIWGTPAEESHDSAREGSLPDGSFCEGLFGGVCPAGVTPKPLLSLPTSCQGPQEFSIQETATWSDENFVSPRLYSATHDNEDNPIGFTGCERLQPFNPELSIAPDTSYADTPTGLSVDVKLPQGLNPEGYATPGLKDTTVVLPEGIAINPGQATGLVACQPSQEALGTLPDGESNEGPPSCPSASKVGTDEISTPLLPNKLRGTVYILGQNPPNLQLMIAASGEGVNLKLVGTVHLDENTGQLVTTFDNTPDVPFTDFKLNFSGGAQAALATPTKCGSYGSNADFTPWSSPFVEDWADVTRFAISAGPSGSPCVWPMPFSPSMIAGATTDQAGGFTDFTMLLQRGDEQQRIKTLSFTTPEGLLGMISRVVPCPEPQAAAGTCSAASQIGHTVVGAGPGPYPFYIPQAGAPPAPIYLTGPYDGAPFGLSIVVPLIAGPFDLGTEVVRARLDVDRSTSQVTITTNPLPVTEKGIPDDLRLIDAVIDRPEFMFNPTSCAPMSFSGTATSTEGATAPLSSHFQMGSCRALKFQPDFKVSTSGRTSRKDGASLTAKIVYPVGNLGFNQASSQSNIKTVKVDLPKQLPSRLPTLQKACTARQFDADPAGCPAASMVGHAKAITPVLPVPLEGPAYFVSHGGEAFPNLIVVLQGDNVTVDLVGDTFINEHTNITSSTFKQVPDVPIQSFELNLPQGPYSALAANTNLCKVKGGLHMPTIFTAQNGATIKQNTQITINNCTKTKPKTKKAKPQRAKQRSAKEKSGKKG